MPGDYEEAGAAAPVALAIRVAGPPAEKIGIAGQVAAKHHGDELVPWPPISALQARLNSPWTTTRTSAPDRHDVGTAEIGAPQTKGSPANRLLTSSLAVDSADLLSPITDGLGFQLDPLVRRPEQRLVLADPNLHRLEINVHAAPHLGVRYE